MNILITGGAGYVGSVLTSILLANGDRVRVMDILMHGGQSLLGVWSHPDFEFFRGDVRNPDNVREALKHIDAVVHLAAIVGDPACARQPDLARATNLDASLALLQESQHAGCAQFVFASTCSNYGKTKDPNQLVDETSELCPVSLYAETKVAVERAILDSSQTGNLCATSLRLATVFGVSPRMRFDLTVNEFTMEMITKKHLVVFGEQFWRPYVHVRDAARALTLVLHALPDKVKNQVFNVGSTEQNFQKRQLVELIRPYVPEAVVEFVHKNEDPRNYRVSFAKIKSAIEFEISRTVQNGIREVAMLVQSGVIQDFSHADYRN